MPLFYFHVTGSFTANDPVGKRLPDPIAAESHAKRLKTGLERQNDGNSVKITVADETGREIWKSS
jgi:hypothetical protein